MDPSKQLDEMFPPEYRKMKMWSNFKWGLINLILAGYLLFFLIYFWDDWDYSD